MIIDCISDLHGNQPILKGGDLLIVAGDMTARDRPEEWVKFYEWLYKQPYRKIIMIAGNHDGVLKNVITTEELRKLPVEESDMTPDKFEYLRDNFCIFEGLKIYGMPWTPPFFDWHFMKGPEEMREMVNLIPEDVDILITHGPGYGILDKVTNPKHKGYYHHAGCKELGERLKSLKQLKLHVFGHIHESPGFEFTHRENHKPDGYLSVNACIMDGNYNPTNKPIRVMLVGTTAVPVEETPKD
jgi:Icc-related predicted phosphoesterase